MKYEHPLSDYEVDMLAEFTFGAVAVSEGSYVGSLPETIPRPAVQATIEGRVSNWEDINDNEYEILFERIEGAAEALTAD